MSYVLLLLKVPARWEISPQIEEKRITSGFESRDNRRQGEGKLYISVTASQDVPAPQQRSCKQSIPRKVMPPSRTQMEFCQEWILRLVLIRARAKNACWLVLTLTMGMLRLVVDDADIEMANGLSA